MLLNTTILFERLVDVFMRFHGDYIGAAGPCTRTPGLGDRTRIASIWEAQPCRSWPVTVMRKVGHFLSRRKRAESGIWGSTGSWTQSLKSTKQWLYHLSHSARAFCVGYFGDGVSLYTQAGLDHKPPNCASLCSCDDRYTGMHPAIGWDGVSQMFGGAGFEPGSSLTASWVARITSMSPHGPASKSALKDEFAFCWVSACWANHATGNKLQPQGQKTQRQEGTSTTTKATTFQWEIGTWKKGMAEVPFFISCGF
jgi:hypothetical protein